MIDLSTSLMSPISPTTMTSPRRRPYPGDTPFLVVRFRVDRPMPSIWYPIDLARRARGRATWDANEDIRLAGR